MKVLHLISNDGLGGIRTLVRDLADQQGRRDDLHPAVMFARLKGGLPTDFIATGALIYDAGLTSGYDVSPAKIWRVRRIFQQYDIIHFHFFSLLFALSAALSRGPKIVYTFHGLFGFFRKPTKADRTKKVLLTIFLKLFTDFISYNSKFTKNTAIDYYSTQNINGKIIYNGLVLSSVRGSRDNIPEEFCNKLHDKFVVAGFGRFVRMKRFDRLISGFARFKGGKDDTVLLLVGDGILKEGLTNEATSMNVTDNTVFTGFQRKIHDYQDAADICVVSSAKEPFGLVAVEAMAMGIPVIAFADGGGVVEVVGGYSIDDVVQDVEGLARRLDFYYRRHPEATQATEKRKRYAERFDMRHAEAEFFKAYNVIL